MTRLETLPRPGTKPREQMSRARMRAWRKQEPALARAWKDEGCEHSLTTLLERYDSFLHKHVQRLLSGGSLPRSYQNDLTSEAQLAFIEAVETFDPDLGVPLSTHAYRYVRSALLRYALDNRYSYRIGTGSGERKAIYAALTYRNAKTAQGAPDTLTEDDISRIQKETGASEQSTRRAISALYATATDIADADHLSADCDSEQNTRKLAVDSAMSALAPLICELDARERAILHTYLAEEDTRTADLAERFNITPERIGQIRRGMLEKMQVFLQEQGISADALF